MMFGVTWHHCRWKAHIIDRRWAWHALMDLGTYTRSDDVGCFMPLSPLNYTHGRRTLGLAYDHCPWTAHTDGQCQSLNAFISLKHHTRLDDVDLCIQLRPLESTDDHKMSSVACHHSHWIIQIVKWCQSWNAIIFLLMNTQMNNVRHDMRSSPFDSTNGQITLGMACQRRPWTANMIR